MSPSSLRDLDPRHRRRVVAKSVARIVLTIVALFTLYAVIPVADDTGARALVELCVGLLIFIGLLAWLAYSIVNAAYPALRAVEAASGAVAVLIIVFAYTYLSISRGSPSSFSEPLDHATSIYFTVTVLGTVGFGDIVGKSDGARMLVTIQILFDLVVVVGIARLVVFAARVGIDRQRAGDEPPDTVTERSTTRPDELT